MATERQGAPQAPSPAPSPAPQTTVQALTQATPAKPKKPREKAQFFRLTNPANVVKVRYFTGTEKNVHALIKHMDYDGTIEPVEVTSVTTEVIADFERSLRQMQEADERIKALREEFGSDGQ